MSFCRTTRSTTAPKLTLRRSRGGDPAIRTPTWWETTSVSRFLTVAEECAKAGPLRQCSQTSLPAVERVLLGPGPSVIPPRVMRAMAAPVLSHLDPDFVLLLDDVRTHEKTSFSFSLFLFATHSLITLLQFLVPH